MMNLAFCDCGREHVWTGTGMCRCGKVLEAQTQNEFDQRKRDHEAVLKRIANAIASGNDLEPTIRLFRD